jgi:hypothetical protein
LGRRVGNLVRAFELDADGKVVAAIAALPVRGPGMPCAVEATDELDQLTVAPDEEVRRDPKVRNRREVRVAAWLEAIGEEVDDAVAAELPGGSEMPCTTTRRMGVPPGRASRLGERICRARLA